MMAQQELRRVLILDDEQLIANTLALILNRSGFEARAVYDGETAIAAARESSPDVLISDVVMRGMTGIEAAVRISAIVPHCHVILFSGQATTSDLLETAQSNGQRFELLAKPVHPTALLDRLNSLEVTGRTVPAHN